jgi:hypothetical protein
MTTPEKDCGPGGAENVDLLTITPEPLEWPNKLGIQSAYDLGAERMRAAILAVISPSRAENVEDVT